MVAVVALEAADLFAIGVVGHTTPPLPLVAAAFAGGDVAAARPWVLGALLAPRCSGDVGQMDAHGDRPSVEMHHVDIGRLAGIVPGDATTDALDSLGQRHAVLEDNVADIVEHMHAPVAHLAGAGVPVPVPVVVEGVAVDRLVLGRSQPEVVGDIFGDLQRRLPLTDRGPHTEAVDPR